MNTEQTFFRTTIFGLHKRLLMVLFFGGGILWFFYFSIFEEAPQRIAADNMPLSEWISFFLVSVLFLWGLRVLVPMGIELFTCAFTVMLEQNGFWGKSLFGPRKYLLFEDVISIKIERLGFRAVRGQLIVTGKSGKKIKIHKNMDSYGKCIESIKALSPNIQEVDYGGLDKDELIWRGTPVKVQWSKGS